MILWRDVHAYGMHIDRTLIIDHHLHWQESVPLLRAKEVEASWGRLHNDDISTISTSY
jgi:hypothetical protein